MIYTHETKTSTSNLNAHSDRLNAHTRAVTLLCRMSAWSTTPMSALTALLSALISLLAAVKGWSGTLWQHTPGIYAPYVPCHATSAQKSTKRVSFMSTNNRALSALGIVARTLNNHQSHSCPHRKEDCPNECAVALRHCDVSAHLLECALRAVQCGQCLKRCLAHQLPHHTVHECDYRLVWCRYWCGAQIPCIHREAHECMHQDTAERICKFNCGIDITREQKQQHEQHQCPFRHHPDWVQPYMPEQHRPEQLSDEHKHNWSTQALEARVAMISESTSQAMLQGDDWKHQLTPGLLCAAHRPEQDCCFLSG